MSESPATAILTTPRGLLVLAAVLAAGFFITRSAAPPQPDPTFRPLPADPTGKAELLATARPIFALIERPVCRDLAATLVTAQSEQDFAAAADIYRRSCVPVPAKAQ